MKTEDDFDGPDLGPAADDNGPEGDEKIRCWCGAVGTFDELFSDEPYDESCGGSGFLYCCCGGDQCVCHHHGQEIECPGCEDCDGGEDRYDEDDFEDESPWVCGCGEYVDGDWHCEACGNCPPWGCDVDHSDDDPEDVATRYEDDDQVDGEGLEGEVML